MKNKEIKLSLCGCFGRMGQIVIEEAKNFHDIKINSGIDRSGRKNELFPVFDCAENINNECDVILDFSHPSALESILNFSVKNKNSIVICTTGYNGCQLDIIKRFSDEIPIFLSSNTSIGISVLTNIAKIAKDILGEDFDIEIIEKHHNKKLDAPSGTALMIANAIADDSSEFVYERHSRRQKRSKNEIGIHSVRCGGIMGEHEIIFASENEYLNFKHCLNSRKVLAKGALEAVRFVFEKKPGLYSMNDLLEWKKNKMSVHV